MFLNKQLNTTQGYVVHWHFSHYHHSINQSLLDRCHLNQFLHFIDSRSVPQCIQTRMKITLMVIAYSYDKRIRRT